MTVRTLVGFFSITFGLGWGVAALAILFQEQVESVFGEIGYTNPLFIFVVYSPAIAGIYLVGRHYGARGLAGYLKRLTLWRMPAPWWVFLILGIPAIVYAGAALNGTFSDPFPFSTGSSRRWRSPWRSVPSRSSAGGAWPCPSFNAGLRRFGPA